MKHFFYLSGGAPESNLMEAFSNIIQMILLKGRISTFLLINCDYISVFGLIRPKRCV